MDDGARDSQVYEGQKCRTSFIASHITETILDWPDEWFNEDGTWVSDEEGGSVFENWLQKIDTGYGYEAYGITTE